MSQKFQITAPDGHVLEITGPDNATPEQAIAQAQALYHPHGEIDGSKLSPDDQNTVLLSKAERESKAPRMMPADAGLRGPLTMAEKAKNFVRQRVENLPALGTAIGEMFAGPPGAATGAVLGAGLR